MTGTYVPGAVSSLLGSDQAASKKSKDDHLSALFSPNQPPPKKKQGLKKPANSQKSPEILDVRDREVINSPKKKRKKTQLIDDLEEQYETKIAKKQESSTAEAAAETKATSPKTTERKQRKKEFPRPRRDRKKKDTNQDNRTIFVGNLSIDVEKKTVRKIFRKYGEVESLRFRSAAPADLTLPKKAIMIMKNFHDQRQNLNCYLVFKEESAAKEALKENGTELKGLHMRVDLASKSVQHKHSNSIFVGNLPFDAEEEPIRQHFEDCGDIENVRLIRDRKTQLGKGFGYVLFSDKSSVELALKLNGESFSGRKIRISRSSKTPLGLKTNDKKNSSPKDKLTINSARAKEKRNKKKKDFKKEAAGDKGTFHGLKATKNETIKVNSKPQQKGVKFKKSKLGPKKDKKKHTRKIPSSKIGAHNRISKKLKRAKSGKK